MKVDHLIVMANQIGAFFESFADRAEGLDGIATHIRKFWTPPMRFRLAAHLNEDGGEGLSAVVKEAFGKNPAALT